MYKIKRCEINSNIHNQPHDDNHNEIKDYIRDDNKRVVYNTPNTLLLQQQSLKDDISKMHLLPPYCPMTPASYKSFYNDDINYNNCFYDDNNDNKKQNTKQNTNYTPNFKKVVPYKLLVEKHPKDGRPKTKIEYNNFYSDWKTDALKYGVSYESPNEYSYRHSYDNPYDNQNQNQYQHSPYSNDVNGRNDRNSNHPRSESLKLYEETKSKAEFAKPMNSNGSNTLETLYNDCLNKPTFTYKRYGEHNFNQPNKNYFVDNPIYSRDISEETNDLKTEYMNSRETNFQNVYSSVFEDMYILGYDPDNVKPTLSNNEGDDGSNSPNSLNNIDNNFNLNNLLKSRTILNIIRSY